MDQPLLNRFQGTLLGAMLGFALVEAARTEGLAMASQSRILSRQTFPESLFQMLQTRSEELLAGTDSQPLVNFSPTSPAAILAMTLPLGLYYHEQPQKCQQSIQEQLIGLGRLELEPAAFVLNSAIAQIFLTELHPQTLISTLVTTLELPGDFSVKLRLVDSLWQQRATLAETLNRLSWNALDPENPDTAIALGVYCYLSTRRDFRLSLLRAMRLGNHSALAAIVVGALAGASNGWTGIPWRWPQAEMHRMDQLGAYLLAAWAGADFLTGKFQPVQPIPAAYLAVAEARPRQFRRQDRLQNSG